MQILQAEKSINFKRKLKSTEETEYSDILLQGKKAAAIGDTGKSILICPVTSLPQNAENNTGIGNLSSKESAKLFKTAKTYWGINGIQLLPVGQYHEHNGGYPIYSGTSMDLGLHLIDIKSFISENEFNKIVCANKISDKVNFSNILNPNSEFEKVLKNLYKNFPENLQQEFLNYKSEYSWLIEPKAIYRTLRKIHGTYDYKKWGELDANLFDDRVVDFKKREKRIKELISENSDEIDFYKFKQFLAEKSLKNAKEELNKNGIQLYGDMLCGFSYDEVWANPKAFKQNCTIGWNLPAFDGNSSYFEDLLRKKVSLYAKRFDGFRVDASWIYISPNIKNNITGSIKKEYFGNKFLNIIDNEVKKIKGENFDLTNIMHEFAASPADFNIYDGYRLKPEVQDRVKIYTSDWLKDDWGSSNAYKNRGWSSDEFIIGVRNHDSAKIEPKETQAETLGKILNIPKENLLDIKEFVKAKFAEPLSAKNTMLFVFDALGINEQYAGFNDPSNNYVAKIPDNFEELYHKKLQNGEGFNPMDALEKQFKAQGLDKSKPDLYKKIVKYRKILAKKDVSRNKQKFLVAAIGTVSLIFFAIWLYNKKEKKGI